MCIKNKGRLRCNFEEAGSCREKFIFRAASSMMNNMERLAAMPGLVLVIASFQEAILTLVAGDQPTIHPVEFQYNVFFQVLDGSAE